MKHVYRSVAFCAAVFFVSIGATAQQTAPQISQVIIEVPGIVYERGYPDVAGSLLLRDGISIVGFCERMGVILLEVDRTKQPDDTGISDAIRSLNLPFYIKEAMEFDRVITECGDSYIPIESSDSNEGQN